ncbi:MAG: FmdE family protein [Thermodesulfobacteriota bacterium]|nr:FmdE family protein [Thermodesulfobacteriota bacterium]
MMENPGQEVERMIQEGDFRGIFEKATEFHGHYCHKVAYGVKAGLIAMKELGIRSLKEEGGRIVAIADSSGPFCNGIQVALGLTLAHSDFVVRDLGKLALTLLRDDGSAARVSLRPEFLDGFAKRNPELEPLMGGRYATIPVPEEKATPLTIMQLMQYMMDKMGIKDETEMKGMMEKMMGTVKAAVLKELETPDEEMFRIEKKSLDFSEYAPVCQCTHPIAICESCKEVVFEPYIRIKKGKNICVECAGEQYSLLSGGKIFMKM